MSTQPVDDGWVPDDSTFRARLGLVVSRMGWSNHKQAARALGVNDATWRNWLRGVKPHDYAGTCAQVADVTGCDLDWLMRGPRRDSAHAHTTGGYGAAA